MSSEKQIEVSSLTVVDELLATIRDAARKTQMALCRLGNEPDALRALAAMKFESVGVDPLDPGRPLNVIEQLNQTFTYVASLDAVKRLMERHPEASSFTLNLGTRPGWDVESEDCGGIIAEVFAATHPASNNKLKKDIKKVSLGDAAHKYAFFMCPGISAGPYSAGVNDRDVVVESLGPYEDDA